MLLAAEGPAGAGLCASVAVPGWGRATCWVRVCLLRPFLGFKRARLLDSAFILGHMEGVVPLSPVHDVQG